MRPHINSEFDTAASAVRSFSDFRLAFRETLDKIFVQSAGIFDDVAALVIEFFSVGLDESYRLLEVGPFGELAEGDFFLNHVE